MVTARFSIFIIIVTILCSSCATILNSDLDKINIITTQPSKLQAKTVLYTKKDTLEDLKRNHTIIVDRSDQPLKISLESDSTSREIIIPSKTSFSYLLNACMPPYSLPGLLVDLTNDRRFNYPKTIFVDFSKPFPPFYDHLPRAANINARKHLLKITPFRLIGITHSKLELTWEHIYHHRLSSQLEVSYFFPKHILASEAETFDVKGFDLGVEQKIYLVDQAPEGAYLGLEVNYARFAQTSMETIIYDTIFSLESMQIVKQNITGNLKLGYQFFYSNLVIDMYLGLGIRHRTVKHIDRLHPDEELIEESSYIPSLNQKGKYWTFTIPFNFSIGWAF